MRLSARRSGIRPIADTGPKKYVFTCSPTREDRRFRQQLREGRPPVRWRRFHAIPNHRRQEGPPDFYYGTRAGPQQSEEGYRIIWVRSSQKADLDRQLRDHHIRQAELELHALAGKVGTRRLRTRSDITKKVASILSAHAVADLLQVRTVSFTEVEHRYLRRGRPRAGDPMRKIVRRRLKLEIARDKEAIRREAGTDGVFPLITNLHDRSRREVLDIYKYQPYLEKRFALTKSEYGIAPIFLKKPVRVVGLMHVYFLAIMLSALLEREVRQAMASRGLAKIPVLPEGRATATPTTPRILENFSGVAWQSFQEAERVLDFPVQLNDTQRLLLDLGRVPATLYR
jgi:transposase